MVCLQNMIFYVLTSAGYRGRTGVKNPKLKSKGFELLKGPTNVTEYENHVDQYF